MTREKNIKEIILKQVREITKNSTSWMNFLDSACYTNKYSFPNQLLIYSQNPKAKAVASMDLWNKKFKRWVNRGAKGIPIIDRSSNSPKIRYVFDISNTHTTKFTTRDVRLWEFDKERHEPVLAMLEEEKNISRNNSISLEERIDEYVQQNIDGDSLVSKANSIFGIELNSKGKKMLQDLEIQSVSYMTMKRMGLDPVSYFKEKDRFDSFENINGFSSLNRYSTKLFSTLGSEIMDHYTNISRDLANGIREIEKNQKMKEKSLQESKKASYTMNNERKSLKNNNKAYSEDLKGRGIDEDGESNSRGEGILRGERGLHSNSERVGFRERRGNISSGGGLSVSQPGIGSEGEKTDREIREPKEDLSIGKQESPIQLSRTRRRATNTSSRHQRTSQSEIESNDETDDEELQRRRGFEGQRSNGMGKTGKQYQSNVRRSDLQGNDLRLGETEQLDLFKNDEADREVVEQNTTTFSISQEEIDSILINHGTGFEHGKFRIAEFFANNPTNIEAAEFLQKEYGIGGWSSAERGDFISSAYSDAKGLKMEKGDTEITLKWTEVSKRINELISMDLYLTIEEKQEFGKYYEERNQEYDLGFGHLGNGITVYNRKKEINNDYETIAHISDNGEVTYYKEYLPYEIKNRIENQANISIQQEQTGELISEEIPSQEEHNFRITDDSLGVAGPKTKYKWNIEAIKTLKKIETEQRLATPEEQEILSKYVGWGGLPYAFDERNTQWAKEYSELKELLTDEEYLSARESTLNAHYTAPTIIKAMYKAIDNMGFKKGNILEPSCGTGNFIGLIPENMKNSQLYGVELDDLTGRIAKQLYQKSDITINRRKAHDFNHGMKA